MTFSIPLSASHTFANEVALRKPALVGVLRTDKKVRCKGSIFPKHAHIDKIMLTDAPLLFLPGQLALAALHSANQVHRLVDFDRYLGSMLSLTSATHSISELVQSLNAIDSWARRYKFPSEKEMYHINGKLKSCWGQSSHDESKKHDKKSKHKS